MRTKFTERQVKRLLIESAFNPRKDHDYKVIADVGNIDYYMRRGTELATEAIQSPEKHQDRLLRAAISLLVLARLNLPCNQTISPKKGVEKKPIVV